MLCMQKNLFIFVSRNFHQIFPFNPSSSTQLASGKNDDDDDNDFAADEKTFWILYYDNGDTSFSASASVLIRAIMLNALILVKVKAKRKSIVKNPVDFTTTALRAWLALIKDYQEILFFYVRANSIVFFSVLLLWPVWYV